MVGLEDSAHPTTNSILKVITMGRTLDILKHTRAGPVSLKIAPQLPQASRPAILPLSEGAEEVPFVEVGGPNHELQGSAGVLAHPASRSKVSDGKPSSEKHNPGDVGTGITNLFSSNLNPKSSILDLPL